MAKGLDTVGWFIATLHQFLGHEKTRQYLGQASREDESTCMLCRHERGEVTRQDVIECLGVEVA